MKAANCYDRQFKSFPKCLTGDVEVIDLTFNRIRKVSRADLSKFSYLKFLYLADNLLSKLDGDVFDDLTSLTTLDLSLNALNKVPPSVFQLPSLKSLYIGQNWNINIVDALEVSRPIQSPLTQIDISQTTDEENYSNFPDFGILPFLVVLNITGNFYFSIRPALFMGLCNLQKLINDNVTTEFEDACDCWKINNWLKLRKIKFTPFTCNVPQAKCLENDFKEDDLQIYNQCSETFKHIQKTNLIIKSSIGVGVGLIVILFLIGIFLFWRRRNKRRSHLQNRKKSVYKPCDN